MSWAEEQDWFGLEDLANEAYEEEPQREPQVKYYVVLKFKGQEECKLINNPFSDIEDARNEMFYLAEKHRCKAYIVKSRI